MANPYVPEYLAKLNQPLITHHPCYLILPDFILMIITKLRNLALVGLPDDFIDGSPERDLYREALIDRIYRDVILPLLQEVNSLDQVYLWSETGYRQPDAIIDLNHDEVQVDDNGRVKIFSLDDLCNDESFVDDKARIEECLAIWQESGLPLTLNGEEVRVRTGSETGLLAIVVSQDQVDAWLDLVDDHPLPTTLTLTMNDGGYLCFFRLKIRDGSLQESNFDLYYGDEVMFRCSEVTLISPSLTIVALPTWLRRELVT